MQKVTTLKSLAEQINTAHEKGEAARRQGLEHYRRAGEALIQAKSLCVHGEWQNWLKANVRCTDRRARQYMQFAEFVKSEVTTSALEKLEQAWRRISGNDKTTETPRPNTDDGSPLPPAEHVDPPAGIIANDLGKIPTEPGFMLGLKASLIYAKVV